MGVKQLWNLLGPVGRPILLETMEGKALAIDSSIWIYQFQATMRDKDGRGLVNAHLLGFLRRICKLLYYGINPVFVFDGGAPILKRATLRERRKKKSGAADSHARVAEKLLAAQLRQAALKHVSKHSTQKPNDTGVVDKKDVSINEDAVFLEDLERDSPRRPPATKHGEGVQIPAKTSANHTTPEKKKNNWQDHDPYKLPELDMERAVAQASSAMVADPRLATAEELQAMIDDLRPEDLDVNLDAFRELPTEVQYEVIGDMRLKSRQTSHKRLQAMLRAAETPLDFSRAQIQNLQKRNSLTQQLLVTMNMVSRANLTIPIRVASERNREYLLVKNDDVTGGWVLGVRDEGTQQKPIAIDVDSGGEEDGIPSRSPRKAPKSTRTVNRKNTNSDMIGFGQQLALASMGKRQSPQKKVASTSPPKRPGQRQSLFIPEEEEEMAVRNPSLTLDDDDMEESVEAALFQSMEDAEADELERALKASLDDSLLLEDDYTQLILQPVASSSRTAAASHSRSNNGIENPQPTVSPMRGPVVHGRLSSSPDQKLKTRAEPLVITKISAASMLFGLQATELSANPSREASPASQFTADPFNEESGDDSMEEVRVDATSRPSDHMSVQPDSGEDSDSSMEPVLVPDPVSDDHPVQPLATPGQVIPSPSLPASPKVTATTPVRLRRATDSSPIAPQSVDMPRSSTYPPQDSLFPDISQANASSDVEMLPPDAPMPSERRYLARETPFQAKKLAQKTASTPVSPRTGKESVQVTMNDVEPTPDEEISWSRSPSPLQYAGEYDGSNDQLALIEKDTFDAADEMDPNAEGGDFAKFIAQVSGRDIDIARKEVEAEIIALNKEKKNAMRDSEDVTQQMVVQIQVMLKLFGIPYVTAPMEAEAQCAALVEYGLVDGVITDDSDIFLFGGLRVFRNMFNQSKTVECFLLADLARELGLDRDKLIRLAYLLGSDYVDGLPGVGPVVAMELLDEFPGEDGLHAFRRWWQKVQNGKDMDDDNQSSFRKRFKKKFKDLYLPEDWPNPAVRDAYYHPALDESREGFKWALPDIEGLRTLLQGELGWEKAKVDSTLLPIVKRVGQRGRANAINKQSNLNGFFDISTGAGSYAPHQKNAYASKRLQKLVTNFRKGKGKALQTEDVMAEAEDSTASAEASGSQKANKSRKKLLPRKKAPPVKKRKVTKGVESEEDEDAAEEPEDESLKLAKELSRPRRQPKRSVKEKEKVATRTSDDEGAGSASSEEFEPG